MVFHCKEVNQDGEAVGPRLVAKETRFQELMHSADFHHAFCRTQAEAQALAVLFNRRARGPPAWTVGFLDCVAYRVRDDRWPGGTVVFLAEPVSHRIRTGWALSRMERVTVAFLLKDPMGP